MKFWFDTEFIDDGKTVELLSIGIVSEDGREYYAEAAETDRALACEWVKENVFPGLTGPVMPKHQIAREIVSFAGASPEFWAYYAAYDWVVLCQLYGRMMALPRHWPQYCNDLKQLVMGLGNPRLLEQTENKHNALADAKWCLSAWKHLVDA